MNMKMKKKLKRLCSLMVVFTLVLAAAAPAFAAQTGTITLHTGDQNVDTVTFKAYRLMDATATADGAHAAYTVNQEFKKFFTEKANTSAGATADEKAYDYLNKNVKTEEFKTALESYIKTNATTVTDTEGVKSGKDVTFDNLPYGYYAIIPTSTAVGSQTLSPSFVTLSGAQARANLKGLTPGADKKVVESEGSKEWGDAAIGQTVKFEVTSMVPDMTGFNQYTFKLVDTMSKGLTVDEATLNPTVKFGDKTLTKDNGLKVNIEDNKPATGQTTITIEITNFIDYKQYADETIIFTYNAVLNEEAISANPETNTAHVEYGNNPDDLTDSSTDTVKVRTYDLEIEKHAESDEGELLGGAEFKLYQGTNKTTPIKFVEVDKTNGTYRVAKEGESNIVETVVTPSAEPNKGIITIKGLDQGNYILEETKAPDGYNKLKDDIKVTIEATSDDKGETVTVEGSKQNVVNKAGTLLPGTGGMGTLLFTLVGVAGVAAILYSFAASKKKTHGEE